MITKLKRFYVDSRKRVGGTDENFSYQLNILPQDNFNRVCIQAISIPKSYYVIQSGFNTFTLQEGKTQVTVTLIPANYTRSSFARIVVPLLNAASPGGWTYTCSFPNPATQPDTNKFSFSVSGNSSQPSFIFSTNGMWEQMGFTSGSTNVFSSNTLVSVNSIKMQGEDVMLIHSSLCVGEQDSILMGIYADNVISLGSIQQDVYDLALSSRDMTTNTSNIHTFALTDENNVPIILNGLNINFTLLCYRWEPISVRASLGEEKINTQLDRLGIQAPVP